MQLIITHKYVSVTRVADTINVKNVKCGGIVTGSVLQCMFSVRPLQQI